MDIKLVDTMPELETIVGLVAKEIVNQTIWENYKFYLLVIAISLVSSSIAVFLASYFKKRGENLATKADFDDLLQQLKDTTTLAEGIKTDIRVKFDEEKNVRELLRQKIESIFEQTYELELWFENNRDQG